VIAKITQGGSFGGLLDYLMNPKKDEQERRQEREQARAQGREQGQAKGAERAPSEEAKGRDKEAPPGDRERERPSSRERQEKGPQTETQDTRREQVRDLADEYEPGQRHRVIGGNLSGQNPRELAREFRLVRELRPDVEKPVHHVSISAGEHDRLTVEQWQEIAGEYVEKMGFGNSPHVVMQHRGSKRDHIHIVASRVDEDGRVVSEWKSKQRAEEVMREVEKKYDLERLPLSKDVTRSAPTRAEKEVFERTGKMSAKLSMQARVERALRDGPTTAEFIEKLQTYGIETIPYMQPTGRVSGVSFRQGKELMKGSDLGRGFSWGGLQKRGLSYDPERDRPAVEAARQRAVPGHTPEQAIPKLMPTPEPDRSFADSAKEVMKSAGEYLLDRANPVSRIEGQLHMMEQAGRGVVELYDAAKDLLHRQSGVEQLRQAAGADLASKNSLERLQEAAGLEAPKDGRDALERLQQATGLDRADPSSDPTHSPDTTLDRTPGGPTGIEPTIEQGIERKAAEPALEIGLELFF
jgi:hypothetical protein